VKPVEGMRPLVANAGHVVMCVNCRTTATVPDEVFERVDLYLCGKFICQDRNAVVEVFDRIAMGVGRGTPGAFTEGVARPVSPDELPPAEEL
jgi:hypothetical protein